MDSEYSVLIIIAVIIAAIYIVNKIASDIIGEKKSIQSLKRSIDAKEKELLLKEHELKRKIAYIEQKDKEIKTIIGEKSQEFPYLALVLSEWQHMHDTLIADMLENKKHRRSKPPMRFEESARKSELLIENADPLNIN